MNKIHIPINKKLFEFIGDVTEAASDYDFTGSFEYKRPNGSLYMYDANGSLVADESRGIAYVFHNAYPPTDSPHQRQVDEVFILQHWVE